jgi:pilus assembly protein CpaB
MLRVVILFIAISAGGLCAWLLVAAKPTPQAIAVPSQTAQVLVASADLTQGQIISEKDLRWQPWPQEGMSPIYISQSIRPDAPNSLKGSMVRARFVAGEPIQEEKLSRVTSGMLASMLPAGKRAVAIRVSAESTAGGFILPNDRVDVIRTSVGSSEGASVVSEIILSNIRVLAIGQNVQERNGEKVVTGETATLELTPPQSEMIVQAQKVGQLSLALRSLADVSETGTPARETQPTALQVIRYGVPHQASTR